MAGETSSDRRPDGAGAAPACRNAPGFGVGPVGETWLGLNDGPLPIDEVACWIGRPDCGAVVVFRGDARDHAEGREDVTALEYEAYESQVVPRLGRLADEARNRWPTLGRIALIHRTGPLAIGEADDMRTCTREGVGEKGAACKRLIIRVRGDHDDPFIAPESRWQRWAFR